MNGYPTSVSGRGSGWLSGFNHTTLGQLHFDCAAAIVQRVIFIKLP